MKGLVLKDLYSIRILAKSLALIILFYLMLSIYNASTGFSVFVIVFLANSAFIQAFASDQNAKWDRYVVGLPVNRRTVVGSRYVFGLIIVLISGIVGLFITTLTCALSDAVMLDEALINTASGVVLIMFMMGLLFPVLFHFGAEKGRIIFAAIIMLVAVGVAGFLNNGIEGITNLFSSSDISVMGQIGIVFIGALAFVSLVVLISYFVSVWIMEKKKE